MFKVFICDFQVIQGFDLTPQGIAKLLFLVFTKKNAHNANFYDLCSLYLRHLCSIICCTNEIFRAPGFISKIQIDFFI